MIYLDHAATSRPKAPGVADAVARWYAEIGVSADRGDSALCADARSVTARARAATAALCGVGADRVAFTSGATESIHLFLQAALRDGDAVLTTCTEHSSLARPLAARQRAGRGALHVVDCDTHGRVPAAAIAQALRDAAPERVRLVAVNHASNVTGALQDAAAIVHTAREHGALTLLDASQTAGVVPIDVDADAVVFSAHKALLGPPGLGVLALRAGIELPPPKPGGSGSSQALDRHPEGMPQSFEAGTPNSPAIYGYDAALQWRSGRTSELADSLARLDGFAAELAAAVPGVRLWHPPASAPRIPVLSFVAPHVDPAEAGMLFDLADVHVRSGHHCAPWIHARLGTAAGGTVRISPGPFVSAAELATAARVLAP